MLPRRSPGDLDAHFNQNDFQSNHMDSGCLSSNATPSLSGLGIRNLDFSKDLESKSYSQDNLPIPHAQIHRYGYRTPRLESTYDTLNDTWDSFMKPLDYPTSIPSTWSFSSVMKAAELAADEAVHEMRSALSFELGLGDLGTTSMILDTEARISWAFEKLPAIPEVLTSGFITQLPASDSTLKQTAVFGEIGLDSAIQHLQIPVGDDQTQTTYNFPEECPITSVGTSLIPKLSLAAVDINMCNANLKNSCSGVNPADILPPPSSPSHVPVYYPHLGDSLSLSTNQSTIVGDLFRRDNAIDLEYPIFQTEVTSQFSHDVVPAHTSADSKASKQPSDDEHSVSHSPTSSDYSPSLKSPVLKQTFPVKGNKRRIFRTKSAEECDFVHPETHDDCQQAQDLNLPINLGTPVLDAHRGVELEELKAKAERYRLRNQGRDYDKRWLISFAGKLSMRGELVEEFRCYIVGCQQVNKRRDHILIHVGAHLDQRPFKCRHWYVSTFTNNSFLSGFF